MKIFFKRHFSFRELELHLKMGGRAGGKIRIFPINDRDESWLAFGSICWKNKDFFFLCLIFGFVSWLSSKFSIPLKLDKIESNVYRWRRCCQFRSEKKFLLFESLQILYNGWHFCRLSHLLKSGNRVDEKWMRTGVTKWKNLFASWLQILASIYADMK